MEREINLIGINLISALSIQHSIYLIRIIFNPLGSEEGVAIIRRQFEKILPAHMVINISVMSLTLNSSPQGTLNDVIPHTI